MSLLDSASQSERPSPPQIQGARVRRLMHKQVHPGGAMGSQRPRGRQPKGALYVIETVLDLLKVDPRIGQKLARDSPEVPLDKPRLTRGRIVGSRKRWSNPKSAPRSRICPKSIQKSIKSRPKTTLRFPRIHPSRLGVENEGLGPKVSPGRCDSAGATSQPAWRL